MLFSQARKLEDMVLMMAQKGQVKEQITDGYLKQMLESISEGVRACLPLERRQKTHVTCLLASVYSHPCMLSSLLVAQGDSKSAPAIKIDRRRFGDDDDSDVDLDGL